MSEAHCITGFSDLFRLKARIEQEYRQKVAAIEMVAGLLKNGEGNTDRFRSLIERFVTEGPGSMRTKLSVTGAIRRAVRELPEPFSVAEVVDCVKEAVGIEPDREMVAITLWRMAKKGEIRLIEKGRGKQPPKYERLEEQMAI